MKEKTKFPCQGEGGHCPNPEIHCEYCTANQSKRPSVKTQQIERMVETMTTDCTRDYWHLSECRDKGCDRCKAEKLVKAGYKK